MPSKNGENVTPSHIMTQTEWEEMMARKVLAYTTDALLVDFRYMGSAFQVLAGGSGRTDHDAGGGRSKASLLCRAVDTGL